MLAKLSAFVFPFMGAVEYGFRVSGVAKLSRLHVRES